MNISGKAEVSQMRNTGCWDVKEGLEEVQGLTQKCETSVLGRKKKDGFNKSLFDACENSEKGVNITKE